MDTVILCSSLEQFDALLVGHGDDALSAAFLLVVVVLRACVPVDAEESHLTSLDRHVISLGPRDHSRHLVLLLRRHHHLILLGAVVTKLMRLCLNWDKSCGNLLLGNVDRFELACGHILRCHSPIGLVLNHHPARVDSDHGQERHEQSDRGRKRATYLLRTSSSAGAYLIIASEGWTKD